MAVLALAVAAGCDSKKEAVMTSGIDLTNLDTTAVQGADFYQYACGGWMKKHPLTNEYSRFGSFDMLAENNREQLKGLIVEIAAGQNAQGTIGQKIGDIYNLAMDSVAHRAAMENGLKTVAVVAHGLDTGLQPDLCRRQPAHRRPHGGRAALLPGENRHGFHLLQRLYPLLHDLSVCARPHRPPAGHPAVRPVGGVPAHGLPQPLPADDSGLPAPGRLGGRHAGHSPGGLCFPGWSAPVQ